MIAAMVTIGCAPAAWFADERHADVFADSLRAAGVLGVSVVDTATAIPDVLDRLHSALDGLDRAHRCAQVCECGAECDGEAAIDDQIESVREAIELLEAVGA